MKCRNILLSSVIALAGTLAAAPGFAQNTPAMPSAPEAQPSAQAAPVHHARHHVRTASRESRSERKATEQLNAQQLAKAQAGADVQTAQAGSTTAVQTQPAAATGTPQSANSAASTEAAGSAPAPSDTNSNVGATQTPSGAADSNTMAQTKMSANTSSATMPAAADASPPQNGGAMPVTQVQNAQQKLASAKVEGAGGKPLGTVQQISSDANGAPAKVQVELDQSLGLGVRSVWIDANQLQYEPQSNEVTTNLTPQQLNSM